MRWLIVVLMVVGLLGVYVTPSSAQMEIGKGVMAGLNLANLGGDDVENVDTRTAFKVGGFVSFPVSETVNIRPEVYYTMKGATQKFDYMGTTVKLTYKLSYVEIPVLLRLNLPLENASVLPGIFVGPALAIKTGGKVKAEAEGQSEESDIEDMKSMDFGVVFGLGVNVSGFMLDVRYNLGLTTIDDSADPDDVKNRVLSFNIGYGF